MFSTTKIISFTTRSTGLTTRLMGLTTRLMGLTTRSIGHATRSIGFATRSIGHATRSIGFATRLIGFATGLIGSAKPCYLACINKLPILKVSNHTYNAHLILDHIYNPNNYKDFLQEDIIHQKRYLILQLPLSVPLTICFLMKNLT